MADPSIMFGGFRAGSETGDGRTCGCCGGGCGVLVCVSSCPFGDPVVGAIVTINSFPPCTTGPGGCCVVNIGSGGTYTLTVTATGYQTWSGTMTMHCSQLIPIELRPNTDPPTVTIGTQGCCAQGAPFFTVTLSDGQTCTSDALGTPCNFWIANPGTYTYSITAPRFDPTSGSFTIASSCQFGTTNIIESLTPSSGYICVNWVPYPIPITVFYSDTQYGAIATTYDGVSLLTGTDTVSYPGGCGCPASGTDREVDIDAQCAFGNPVIEVRLTTDGSGCPSMVVLGVVSRIMTIASISATAPLVITGSSPSCATASKVFPSAVTFTVTE